MRFTRIILSIVFVLFASSAFAEKPEKIKKEKKEKPEKILVCHVGTEEGPDGDALKVDLISVSENAKHIGNDAHSFLDAEGFLWQDYFPEDGIGDDPADFEEGDVVGIDLGCELRHECPCWSAMSIPMLTAIFTVPLPALYNYTGVGGNPRCLFTGSDYYRPLIISSAQLDPNHFSSGLPNGITSTIQSNNTSYCSFRDDFGGAAPPNTLYNLTAAQAQRCSADVEAVAAELNLSCD